MRLFPLVGLLLLLPAITFGQTVFWVETFNTGCNANTTVANFPSSTGQGLWSLDTIGVPSLPNPNMFFVSGAEAGMVAGGCGDGCVATPGLTNQSLHISRINLLNPADSAATYNNGPGSAVNLRAISPVINCTGFADITVDFDYIEGGDGALDDATLWYSNNSGLTWALIDSLAKTPNTCGPNVGTWTHFSTLLPASANNNSQVMLAFDWKNNEDGIGQAVSFAVDSIVLTDNDTLRADFTSSATTFCVGGAVSFFDLSNGDTVNSWSWVFQGGVPLISNAQNPTGIVYNNPGMYDVALIVTDTAGGIDTLVLPGYINVLTCPPPTADFTTLSTNICVNQCIDFIDQTMPASVLLWEWNFDIGGTGNVTPNTSTNPNPSYICFRDTGSYPIRLIVTDTLGQRDTIVKNNYIRVDTCAAPKAIFLASDSLICQGESITFTDTSLGNPTNYTWSFPGGTPNTSTNANPSILYNTPGVYNVTLTVTNFAGTDDTIRTGFIQVLACPPPTANFTSLSTTLCEGACATFVSTSLFSTIFVWSFPWASPTFATVPNPTNICYPTTGFYDVQLIASNINGTDTLTQTAFIEVIECNPPVAEWTVEDDSICQGSCIQFFGPSVGVDSILWEFEGADSNYRTFSETNPIVCYSDTGRFSVKLTVSNAFGGNVLFLDDHIWVGEYPSLAVGASQTIIVGGMAQLQAFGTGESYFWQPFVDLSCFNCSDPEAKPEETTIYTVTNTTDLGCSVQDSIEIVVDKRFFVGVPNAFSPNGDDNNDILSVLGNGIGSVEFTVYNRYGQKVFESFDQREGWDGTHNSQEQNPGIYAYVVKVTFNNGVTQELSGNVTLFR
ncbi:MAG: PKD domain-containing protein [Salibacteraceae bacterium]